MRAGSCREARHARRLACTRVGLQRGGGRQLATRGPYLIPIYGFLRNGSSSFGLQGLENKPECLGTPMQIVNDSGAVAGLVGRGPWIDILHSVPHSVVEQDCDLAGRGGHRLGLADEE